MFTSASVRPRLVILVGLAVAGCADRPVAPTPEQVPHASTSAMDERADTVNVIVLLKDVSTGAAVTPQRRAQRREHATGFARAMGIAHRHVYSAVAVGFSARIPPGRLIALRNDPRVLRVEMVERHEPLLVYESVVRAAALAIVFPTFADRVELDRSPLATGVDVPFDIAIIDSGIDSLHPDLNVVGGYNLQSYLFGGPDSSAWNDRGGHGTVVAGMAGARADAIGSTGTAPGARLWAVKVTESGGAGSDNIAAGLDWIAARKQDFKSGRAGGIDFASANLSYKVDVPTGGCTGFAEYDVIPIALCGVIAEGVSMIVAAGNDGGRMPIPTDVLSVSAMADFDGRAGGLAAATCGSANEGDDTLADFSNRGPGIDIAAPGACVLATAMGGGYAVVSGTSVAAPQVAGAVALYLFANGASPATNVSGLRVVEAAVIAAALPQNHRCGYFNEGAALGSSEPLLFLNAVAFGGDGTCDDGNAGPRLPEPRMGIYQVCVLFSGAVGPRAPIVVYPKNAPALRTVIRLPRYDGSPCMDVSLPSGLTSADSVVARIDVAAGYVPYWTPNVISAGELTVGLTIPNDRAFGVVDANKGVTILFTVQPLGPFVPTLPSQHYREPDFGFVEVCMRSESTGLRLALNARPSTSFQLGAGECSDRWVFSGPSVGGNVEFEVLPERTLGVKITCQSQSLAGIYRKRAVQPCSYGRQEFSPDVLLGYLVTYTLTAGKTGFSSVAPARRHTCGLDNASRPFCWGNAENGKTGSGGGSAFPEQTPWGVFGLWDFAAIATGDEHSCALDRNGRAQCWGDNSAQQLGGASLGLSIRPVRVSSEKTFTSLDAGGRNTCAVATSSDIHCWGTDALGTTRRPAAVTAAGFLAVSVGATHACALDQLGSAYCWGRNASGQLGTGDTAARLTPALVRAVTRPIRFSAISAGDGRTCGIESGTGRAWCWGSIVHGALAGASALFADSVPTSLQFAKVTTGRNHDCALTASGAAYCWGSNSNGQLGNGSTSSSALPVSVAGGFSFKALEAGSDHTCAIDAAGLAYCWGRGEDFRLGNGSVTDQRAPILVSGQR